MIKFLCAWKSFSRIKSVKDDIAKNNLGKAFSRLEEVLSCIDNDVLNNTFIIQKSRWNENKYKEETIEKDITKNQISFGLLTLCRDIEDEISQLKSIYIKRSLWTMGIVSILTLISLTIHLNSTPKYLYQGVVMDEKNNTLNFIPIFIYKTNQGVSKKIIDSLSTNNKGFFEYKSNIKSNELYFDIKKEGYQPFSSSLAPTTGENQPSPIILTIEK